MADLSARMGFQNAAAPEGVDSDEDLLRRVIKRSRLTLEDLEAAPSGVEVADLPRWEWLVPAKLPKGRLDLAPSALVDELGRWAGSWEIGAEDRLTLVCRRLPHQMNSDLQTIESQLRTPHPSLLINESDASKRDLCDGAEVRVTSDTGSTLARVEISRRMRRGVVSLPHSWSTPDVNALTSADRLDPITGMPQFTAIPVLVSAVAPETSGL